MSMLKFETDKVRHLQSLARDCTEETCAAGFVYSAGFRQDEPVFAVREFQPVPDSAYLRRTAVAATLHPEFCTDLANAARVQGAGILLAHTHVGKAPLEGFSAIDDESEPPLAQYFARRLPGRANFAAVITPEAVYARHLGPGPAEPVSLVGRDWVILRAVAAAVEGRFDRQVRAFGEAGQQALRALTVAIVGLGGTGSVVAQQLAHLGVSDFILIDPDAVEETNLNRLVGATRDDVGRPKVQVAARHIQAINQNARCKALQADVVNSKAAAVLTAVDFVFACTDSMASRAVLNQLAYQYFVPSIDMGVAIGAQGGTVKYMAGRVQMLSPGLGCLVCTDKLDSDQVRREMMSEEQRRHDPYIVGETVKQPAVISLNSTISSAAVTMFLAAVTGIPANARMLTYDGVRGALKPVLNEPRPHCIVCSSDGALGRGVAWQLPVRGEQQ
jgi:molybdopterin-synthase adenylyltransferase